MKSAGKRSWLRKPGGKCSKGTIASDQAAWRGNGKAASRADSRICCCCSGVRVRYCPRSLPPSSATSAGTLLAGSVVTVEPGVYLPGRGGVRIEDTLVVADGTPEAAGQTPELLTRFPKELAVLS